MVKTCCVTGCKEIQRRGSGIMFHQFPFKRPHILAQWERFLQKENWSATDSSRICSKHFTPSCYKANPENILKYLKDDAVPLLLDPPPLQEENETNHKVVRDSTPYVMDTEEMDSICFVCDKTIPVYRWKYQLQVTATKKRNLPVATLIQQLVGGEFAVLVGERDAVCSHCMNLLNLMDSLTMQLDEVTSTLSQMLQTKYNLASDTTQFEVQYDSSSEETEPVHKCDSCSYETKYEKEFNMHIRTHTTSSQTATRKTESAKLPTKVSTPLKDTPKTPISTPSTTVKTRSTKGSQKKRKPRKSPASSLKKSLRKAPKPKKTRVVFQCSMCDKIFQNETQIRNHAKKDHGNDNIVVSDVDEYEDIQTLESSDEEMPEVKKQSTRKVPKKKVEQPPPAKPKLDFLDDWEEADESKEIMSPVKEQVPDNKLPGKTTETTKKKKNKAKRPSVEQIEDDENDDKDTSSKPTCMFCKLTFSTVQSVQDHVKLSHREPTSHLNIGSKSTTSLGSVASFEIDSTTDIAESKAVGSAGGSGKSYKCNLCGIRKVSLQFIQRHVKAHKRKMSLQCKFCGTSYRNVVARKVHTAKCHKVASIPKKCGYCKFKFFNIVQLKNHIRKVHRKKSVKANSLRTKRSGKSLSLEDTLGLSDKNTVGKSKLQRTVGKHGLKRSMSKKNTTTDSSKISVSEVSSTSLETETEPTGRFYNCVLCLFFARTPLKMKAHFEGSHGIKDEKKKMEILKQSDRTTKHIECECQECGLTFNKASRLLEHVNRHKALTCTNLGICVYCSKLFLDKEQVVLHINSTHENVKTNSRCTMCNKTYSQTKDMKIHFMKTHFSEKTEKLMKQLGDFRMESLTNSGSADANDVYSKVFKELQDLTGERTEEQMTPLTYNCPLCNFHSPNCEEVKNHLPSHTQNYCNICKNLFTSQEVINHIENHNIESQNIECGDCKEKFHDTIHLQFHTQNFHTQEKIHKCSMCAQSFFSQKGLSHHKQVMHGIKTKKTFFCNKCGSSFFSEKQYQTHVEFAHRSTKNCKYCDKTFNRIRKLALHESNHLKQVKSVYKCNVCGKVLKTQSALKTHKNNHASTNSLKCEDCGKTFKSFQARREHSAQHAEGQEKKFSCDICGKGFYFYDSHQRHRRVHLDPLFFQCKICRERFQTNKKLSEHKKICDVATKCSKCLMLFKTISELKRHKCLKK